MVPLPFSGPSRRSRSSSFSFSSRRLQSSCLIMQVGNNLMWIYKMSEFYLCRVLHMHVQKLSNLCSPCPAIGTCQYRDYPGKLNATHFDNWVLHRVCLVLNLDKCLNKEKVSWNIRPTSPSLFIWPRFRDFTSHKHTTSMDQIAQLVCVQIWCRAINFPM